MSDFEVCPCGTLQRLAEAELRADRAEQCAQTEAARADKAEAESRRLSDVVSLVNRRSDHLGIRLREVIAERDALAEANEAFGKRQVWWDNKMLALEAERDALKQTLHDELDGNLRLRELGGARPDEPFTTFIERVISERDALLEALRDMVSDHASLSAATLEFARVAIAKATRGNDE